MTKRILAIVLALVLSLSVLSVEAFAFESLNFVTAAQSGKTISLTWNAPSGGAADYYLVDISTGTTTVVSQARVTTTAYTSANLSASGTYTAIVDAYKSGVRVATYSGTVDVFIEQTSTSGGITVTSTTASSVTVSWSKQAGVTSYHVVYNDGTNHYIDVADATSATINVAYSNLRSVTVSAGDNSDYGTAFASWTNPGSSSPSSVPSTPSTSGNVWISGNTLYWNAVAGAYSYTVSQSGLVALPNATNLTTTSYVIPTDYQRTGATFVVTAYNFYGTSIGDVGYAVYGYNNGIGGVNTGSVYASNGYLYWPGNGSQSYTISMYSGNGYGLITSATYNASGNYYAQQSAEIYSWISRYAGNYTTVYLTVTGANGSTVGSTTYSIYYNGYTGGYVGGYNNGLGAVGSAVGSGTGNYVYGQNCSINVGATSSAVSWGGVGNVLYYVVQYTNNDDKTNQQLTIYNGTTYTNVPLGYNNCNSFTVNIVAVTGSGVNGGQIIGSATYTGSKTSTATKSEYDKLTLTQSGSSTIVSWNAVSGARGYVLYFTRIGGQAADEYFTSTNSYTLSGVGTRLGYELRVLAILSDGRNQHVGSAIHVAGDAYPSAGSTTTTPAQTTSVYVTNFKGTASQTTVSLSWSAASGNPTYELWYKKASASTWKKLGTTSKKAATVSKLSANTAYEFKIIANGRESGILKLSTTSSGTNTATAADPVEAGTASNLPVITSTAGSTGSFTVNWNPVKDADTYQVWVHQEGVDVTADGKQTYRRKATVTGTNATISGLSAGTYRVRIKASKDGGKTYTGLTDCAYVTVTVK